jgi:hypothetical protein
LFIITAITITIINKAGDRNVYTSIDRITRIYRTFGASLTLGAYVHNNTSFGRNTRVFCACIVIITLI